MNTGCQDGIRLRSCFEGALREWGYFDAYERAIENLLGALHRVGEFQMQVKNAKSELIKTRSTYADHMAHCLVCSRSLVLPEAISTVHEKLKKVSDGSVST